MKPATETVYRTSTPLLQTSAISHQPVTVEILNELSSTELHTRGHLLWLASHRIRSDFLKTKGTGQVIIEYWTFRISDFRLLMRVETLGGSFSRRVNVLPRDTFSSHLTHLTVPVSWAPSAPSEEARVDRAGGPHTRAPRPPPIWPSRPPR